MIIISIILMPLLLGAFFYLRSSQFHSSTILLFHDLYDKKFPHSLSEFSVERFTQFCGELKERDIPLEYFSAKTKQSKTLSIIFDDGFLSNLQAAKILKRYELPATFFLCTAHLDGGTITDVYGNKNRLTADQIQEIAEMGFEIGSHTVHHYDLRLLNIEALHFELMQSKKTLESITGREITTLSIPYGLWNPTIIETAKKCGYRTIAVYNFPKQAYTYDEVFPVTGVYPFDSVNDIFEKIAKKRSISSAAANIIPHFAKGSPLAAFRSLYCKLPLPWFTDKS